MSGGNDLGIEPLRDATENEILTYATKNDLPLLGVCRGLQFLCSQYGGRLTEDQTNRHVATSHRVEISSDYGGFSRSQILEVNSFHNYVVDDPGSLDVFAVDGEGKVEGVFSDRQRIAAIMWHPERYTEYHPNDLFLIRSFFG